MAKKKSRSSSTGQYVKKGASSKAHAHVTTVVRRDPRTGRFVTQKVDKNSRVLATTIGGALIGNMIVPGIGGAIVGGLAGALLGNTSDEEADRD